MATPKHTWDTRPWLLGIVGGTVGGSAAAGANYPPILTRLNSVRVPVIGHHGGEAVSVGFGLIGLLVLPCLLTASINLVKWRVYGIHQVLVDWWLNAAVFAGFWVISSGPVAFIRWLRVRAARHQEAQVAAYQAMREAAGVPQEGVWPPPPRPNSGEPE